MLFSFLQYIYKLFLHHWVTFLANSNIINHNLTWKPKVCSCKYGCDYSWWDIEIPVCIFCWMRGPWINCSMTLRVTSNVCNNWFFEAIKFPKNLQCYRDIIVGTTAQYVNWHGTKNKNSAKRKIKGGTCLIQSYVLHVQSIVVLWNNVHKINVIFGNTWCNRVKSFKELQSLPQKL